LKKGFTLIEIICVLAVLSILCVISYPSFNHFLRKDRLNTTTQELIQNLKYAKTYAINHDASSVNVLFQSSDESKGYDNYWIYTPSGGYDMTLKRVYLPKSVWICTRGEGSTFNIDDKIIFKPAGNAAPFACTIVLKDLDTGKKKFITLTIGFTRIMESSGPI
jgi:prepilin-type N-terminal cleavage/methylation domain-containing protein